ncbi:inositol monophosphatase 3 [Archocentrus centrarchus]|uniref:inositol monophosphatase 3 n=1 Tax=Archocentrus centrarchus TaxID=63155 RepID=UPI0011EA4DCB|nr:inositol monophosphatase 3 [Archocentrus centrarchus]
MAPMGIRLSPLGVAVFCLLGVGVIYHLYAGVISSRLAAFRSQSPLLTQQRRTVDLRDLLAVSVEAAELGGKEVKKVREENALQEKSKGKTREGANDPLTMGDLQSHRKMYYLLKNTFPEVRVNSEEHDNVVDNSLTWSQNIPLEIREKIKGGKEVPVEGITVWIDPLDATQEYTESLVKYVTTMVCVAVDGKPVIGVIHQPFTGLTAWAFVGYGSNMHPRSSYSGSPKKVIVSRSHSGQVKSYIHSAFGNSTIIEAGGAGYKVLSLLDTPASDTSPADQADVYIHITIIKKWDICAGAALLKALGGQMTTLKGEDIDYSGAPVNEGGLVASVGMDHKALLERLPTNRDHDKH